MFVKSSLFTLLYKNFTINVTDPSGLEANLGILKVNKGAYNSRDFTKSLFNV